MGRDQPGATPAEAPARVILLVEDDVLVRFTMADMLRDEGFDVVEAANATEALALIATGRAFDIMLSDVRMPGELDGVALTAASKEVQPDLPVVLVSTHLPPEIEHRADAFVSKPYRRLQLLEVIDTLIGTE